MKFETKRRIVIAWLVVLAAWPPIHHVVVQKLDLSPWRWFGWAVYATPIRRILLVATVEGKAKSRDLNAALRRASDSFIRRRIEFGRHVRPDDVARKLFHTLPGIDGISIEVRRLGLDRATGMYGETSRSDPYVYRRGRDGPQG